MKQYLGLTAKKALELSKDAEMIGGELRTVLVWKGTTYIVRKGVVETYRGHADTVVLDSIHKRVVLYA
jgi:hypothetical protein